MEKWIHRFDWVVAFASMVYGIDSQSPLWMGLGALAILLAWWNPTARFRALVQRKLLRRQEAEQWRKAPGPAARSVPPSQPVVPAALPHYTWTSAASAQVHRKS